MSAIKSITYHGGRGDYLFQVDWDNTSGQYIATCDMPNGGLCTAGKPSKLLSMIEDCVRTWEAE